MKLRLIYIFMCLVATFSLHSAFASTPLHYGIAFLHGTSDHRNDADGGYWQRSFINEVAKGLNNPDNVLIVACDYSNYMWTEGAADCTVDQLLKFTEKNQIDKLIVYTHSNGANVLRWILSHPTYDSRFYRISQIVQNVVAIAPSSGGTVLAEEVMNGTSFETAVSWLLGLRSNAVKQQREADMKIYNHTLLFGTSDRPSFPIPFRVIVGSDTAASPVSSSSYCNGYLANIGLKITKMYLDNCADGFLSCRSQMTAGELWFVDKEKTKGKFTLNHNQSRHNCFGLEQVLRQDLQDMMYLLTP